MKYEKYISEPEFKPEFVKSVIKAQKGQFKKVSKFSKIRAS